MLPCPKPTLILIKFYIKKALSASNISGECVCIADTSIVVCEIVMGRGVFVE
jgi:hypothetical protein